LAKARRLVWASAAALAAACGSDKVSGPGTLPVSATVSLAAAEHVLLAGSAVSGAVHFPAAGAQGAQYLVVSQFATGTPRVSSSFTTGGQAGLTGAPLFAALRPIGPAERFHASLRAREAQLARQTWRGADLQAAPPAAPAAPPVLGSKRTFKVCHDLQCKTLDSVPATVLYVGTHAAVFVDDSVPANGFTNGDITQLGATFDTVIHPIDVAAFGPESDVDQNGVVMILLTLKINKLVSKPSCDTSFVTGFFFSADVSPGVRTSYNNGEMFYAFVPDPSPPSTRCQYTTSQVRALLPTVFIHEFQHMISYNQHVLLRGGTTEVLWLNEGMSHLAEELGGLHYDSLGDSLTAFRYLIGNLYNGYSYLKLPQSVALVADTGIGSLEERGASWLFLRYVADHFGQGATRAMVQTSQFGAANVAAATGTPFATLLGRWALAVYLTDLPSFAAPPALTYNFWQFRTVFAQLHQQFPQDFDAVYPLQPSSGIGVNAGTSGQLSSGSGAYLLVGQDASGPGFDLTFRGLNGAALPSSAGAQLAIARIR
jgi:hypothetical protein